MVIQHLKQIGKVKKLNKQVLHELMEKSKKKSSFWSVVFSYSTQQYEPFLHPIVMCDKKWML